MDVGGDHREVKLFKFPIFCVPVRLRASTIFWILTLSDVAFGTFSAFVCLIIVLAIPTWYIIICGCFYLLLYLAMCLLFLDITFVKWRNKSRQTVVKRCKQYTIAR